MDYSVILVGTIRDVSKILEKELSQVYSAISVFSNIDIFLVESDSTDATKETLESLELKYPNLKYEALGNLRETMPGRIERIRYCRNRYVDHVRKGNSKSKWDFVIVADLDGMNSKLDQTAIASCFETTVSWDVCFANQKNGYYDLYALRHPTWMPNDLFEDLWKLQEIIDDKYKYPKNLFQRIRSIFVFDSLRKKVIYDRMKKIKKNASWIEVNSAFGGLAIYRTDLLLQHDYSQELQQDKIYSEHVDFHSKCVVNGANLYINPKLINSHWNIYNFNRFRVVRLLRVFSKNAPKFRYAIRNVTKL